MLLNVINCADVLKINRRFFHLRKIYLLVPLNYMFQFHPLRPIRRAHPRSSTRRQFQSAREVVAAIRRVLIPSLRLLQNVSFVSRRREKWGGVSITTPPSPVSLRMGHERAHQKDGILRYSTLAIRAQCSSACRAQKAYFQN